MIYQVEFFCLFCWKLLRPANVTFLNVEKLFPFIRLECPPARAANFFENLSSSLVMDFLIDGQISSFCPGEHEVDLFPL